MDNVQNKEFSWVIKAARIDYYDLMKVLKASVEMGAAGVELGMSHLENYSSSELLQIKRLYQKNKIAIDSFHLPGLLDHADDDLSCLYDSQRKLAVEKMKYCIDKIGVLEPRVAVLHPCVCNWDVCGQEEFFSIQLLKSIRELLPLAESQEIILAVENLPCGRDVNRFGCLPEHFMDLSENIASPFFGFCFDTGHAWMTEVWNEMFNALKKSIVYFHIHDNMGDDDSHLPPGKGNIDWIDFFNKVRSISFNHPIYIESNPDSSSPDVSGNPPETYSVQDWKSMFKEIEKYTECNSETYSGR